MVNPLNKTKHPSITSSIDKYRNKAIAHFSTYPKPTSNRPPVDIHIENVSDFLQSFDVVYNQNPKTLKWLHIFDLSCLENIVSKFDLHEIVETTLEMYDRIAPSLRRWMASWQPPATVLLTPTITLPSTRFR